MEKQISHSGGWYKWPWQKSQGDIQPCAEVFVQELFTRSVGRGLTQDCGATMRAMLFPSCTYQGLRPATSPTGPSFRVPLLRKQTCNMELPLLALFFWSVNFRFRCQVSCFHFTLGSTNLESPQSAWRGSGKSHLVGFSEGLDATYFWLNWEYHKSKPFYNVSLLSPADSEKHTGMCKLNTDII